MAAKKAQQDPNQPQGKKLSKKQLEQKLDEEQQARREAPKPDAGPANAGMNAMINLKSVGSAQKAMGQALQQLLQDNGSQSDPVFTRGAEQERTTLQDVELLKAHLAQIKLHIPTKTLERGIVMPRDLDSSGPGYPTLMSQLQVDPMPIDKSAPKRAKKGEDKGKKGKLLKKGKAAAEETAKKQLEPNVQGAYKVYEFGNYPLLRDGKPRGGQFRLRLPAEADWDKAREEKKEEEKDDVLR